MADVVEQGDQKGLSRRQMIRASALAGAAAWTAPVIIDSLASPAAAATAPPLSTGISHIEAVFQVLGVAGCTNGNYYLQYAPGDAVGSQWKDDAGASNHGTVANWADGGVCDKDATAAPTCLKSALNAVTAVTVNADGCLVLTTAALPTGVTLLDVRTYCGSSDFAAAPTGYKTVQACSTSTSTNLIMCCVVEPSCPSAKATSSCSI